MNRDTVVASVIGFGLGLVAAISLWVVPRMLPKPTPKTTATETANSAVTSPDTAASGFEITSPKDGEIVKSATVALVGKTPDVEPVTIATATEMQVVSPTDGSYKADVTIKEGVNQIVASSLKAEGGATQTITVYYFNQEL